MISDRVYIYTPPNPPYRADVVKLLRERTARGVQRGEGRFQQQWRRPVAAFERSIGDSCASRPLPSDLRTGHKPVQAASFAVDRHGSAEL